MLAAPPSKSENRTPTKVEQQQHPGWVGDKMTAKANMLKCPSDQRRLLEFFPAEIRNPNNRLAYAAAGSTQLATLLDGPGLPDSGLKLD